MVLFMTRTIALAAALLALALPETIKWIADKPVKKVIVVKGRVVNVVV